MKQPIHGLMKFKNAIPTGLIYSRLVLGLVILVVSYVQVEHVHVIAVSLFAIGLLTDIFDGILARRLQVSSEKLRRLDSAIDMVFFVSVAIAAYIQCPDFFTSHASKLIILGGAEAFSYLICYLKFRKEIATHSIGAKIWALMLFATITQVMLECSSNTLFEICFWFGLITRMEIIAIILTLKNWTNDVPTLYHAIQLRRNRAIKRHKLFNG